VVSIGKGQIPNQIFTQISYIFTNRFKQFSQISNLKFPFLFYLNISGKGRKTLSLHAGKIKYNVKE